MLDINKIVTFAENGVEKFIEEHPSLTFYSFAFACNAEYRSIYVSILKQLFLRYYTIKTDIQRIIHSVYSRYGRLEVSVF
jgi:hypothetical protein